MSRDARNAVVRGLDDAADDVEHMWDGCEDDEWVWDALAPWDHRETARVFGDGPLRVTIAEALR